MTTVRHNYATDEAPFDSGYLKVSDIHSLYYEQHGRKDGKPVIFLHGGPGAQATTRFSLSFFDPSVFRIILFDQRGSGKSVPLGEIRENTSQLLVQDIEVLRNHLSITKWHLVFGGSWGSTLALLYAQTHPEVVSSLVLRGIFLCTDEELDWSFGSGKGLAHGFASIFPDTNEAIFQHLIDAGEDVSDFTGSYYRLLTNEDPEVVLAAARAWTLQELMTSQLHVDEQDRIDTLKDVDKVVATARIEASYFMNRGWLDKDQLLKTENLDRIRNIPSTIVQGRFDVVCPPKYAWRLFQGLGGKGSKSELHWTVAGHLPSEPETFQKLIEVCDKYGSMELS